MTFDLLHIVDIVALCWLFIFCHQGALTPVPANQLLSELQAAVQPTDCSHHAPCVCVCDLLIYVLSWPSYHGDGCMVTGGHTICFVKYIYYILWQIVTGFFFFLNDSWIRNNKWSWLLYSLCWLFFFIWLKLQWYLVKNEDQILAVHKAILPKLYLVGMYCNGFLREAWNSLSSFTKVSLIFNEHQF